MGDGSIGASDAPRGAALPATGADGTSHATDTVDPVAEDAPQAPGPGQSSRPGRYGFAHVPALDGLRGAAVAAVLLYHAGHLTGGYLGVDLFFVLSGYLITSLLVAERAATGRIALARFWERRARRLLPAALALLVGVSAYAWLLARPVDLGQIRGDGLATLFYVANWHTIWQGSSYWDLSLAPSPLQHTWSLAIEEQFYLVWPLVVVLIARRAGDLRRAIGRVAPVLAAVSLALFLGLYAWGASTTRIYEGTDTRAVALLLGIALAAHRERLAARIAPRVLEVLGVVAAAALAVMWVTLDGQSPWVYRGGLPLASLLATVVIAAAGTSGSAVLGRVMSVAPLRWLGLISYGLYLWHWPIYVALDLRNGTYPFLGDLRLDGAVLFVAKVGLSLLAAVVSYKVIENPIRLGALRGRVGLASAIVAVPVVAAIILVATAGAIDAPDEDQEVGQTEQVVTGAPRVLFVGDSVALSLVGPVVADPGRYGINPINAAVPGCSAAAAGEEGRNFAGEPWNPVLCVPNPVTENLTTPPDGVVLYVGARPNDWLFFDGDLAPACDPRFDEQYRENTEALLRDVTDDGAIPSVIATIPPSGEFALPVRESEDRIACINEQIRRVAESVPGASVLDMGAIVCPGGECLEEWEGAGVRSDGVHFDEGPGGAHIADLAVDTATEQMGLPRPR